MSSKGRSSSQFGGRRTPIKRRTRRQLSQREKEKAEEEEKVDQGINITSYEVVERQKYKPPAPDFNTDHMKTFQQYIEEKQLQPMFSQLLKKLLNSPFLPYNPYPGFALRFSPLNEKCNPCKTFDERAKWQTCINGDDFDYSYQEGICCVRGHPSVWGLRNIMRAVSPGHLEKYSWLVNDIAPATGYSSSSALALVGPAMFEGTLFTEVHFAQFRLEVIVQEENLLNIDRGIALFCDSVLLHIESLNLSSWHYVLDLHVPSTKNEELEEIWTVENIEIEKDRFIKAVSEAVQGNLYPTLDCVLCINPETRQYVGAEIQYGINIMNSPEGANQTLMEVATPMVSLYDGVFLQKQHAEQYISLFSTGKGDNSLESNFNAAKSRRPSNSRVLIDGFKTDGPFAQSTTNAVRYCMKLLLNKLKEMGQLVHVFHWSLNNIKMTYLERKVAASHTSGEVYNVIHWVFILYLMDRSKHTPELVADLFALSQSTTGKIIMMMDWSRSLAFMSRGIGSTQYANEIKRNLQEFKDMMELIFDTDLYERSEDIKSFGSCIVSHIRSLIASEDYKMLYQSLNAQQFYCQAILTQIAENSLPHCETLQRYISEIRERHRDAVFQIIHKARQKPDANGGVTHVVDVDHGMEDEKMENLMHERMGINVDECAETTTDFPKMISKEGVLMQYAIDTRLDETWQSFLSELVNCDHLPPNPFPRLLSLLRQQAMRMDLFFQQPRMIVKSLFFNKPRSTADNASLTFDIKRGGMYTVNGVDAHGPLSALLVLDTGAFAPLYDAIQPFIKPSFPERRRSFKISISVALSGPSILYGKTQPYLSEIDLHEHCYIRGPPDQRNDAVRIFSEIVQSQLLDLITKNEIPVLGVYLDEEYWSWQRILNQKGKMGEFSAFIEAMIKHTHQKKPFFMKAFTIMDQWRYVTVKKYFLLHYLTDDYLNPELFYPDTPITTFQSIFFSQERAAFHYQNGETIYKRGNLGVEDTNHAEDHLDQLIVLEANQNHWLEVHRGLLMKNLVSLMQYDEDDEDEGEDLDEFDDILSQEQKHVVESWHMLHSSAGLIEYMVALTECLQDLTKLYIESEEYRAKHSQYLAKQAEKVKPETPPKEKKQKAKQKEKDRKKREKLEKERREKEKKEKKTVLIKRQMKKGDPSDEHEIKDTVKEEELWEGVSVDRQPVFHREEADFVIIENFKVTIDESVFGRMAMIYEKKLRQVLAARICLFGGHLKDFIERRLSPCFEEDPSSRNLYMSYNKQTITRLEEIKHLLRAVQDCLAADVHQICPEAQSLLAHLASKYPDMGHFLSFRPLSVT